MSMKKQLLGISVALALVMLVGSVPLGFAEPLRVQLEQGIEIDQLQCNNDSHVLVQRSNGSPACVSERTAERTGWKILKTEFIHTEKLVTIPEPTIAPVKVTPTIVMIDQSSDVEFVDDGREIFFSKLQASAPPRNYYNTIMTHLSNNDSVFSNDGKGIITLKSSPHEKYSVKEGVGLYLEDWLTEFIPEGQRLLYSTNMYHENGAYYKVTHNYVPTTFELTPEISTSDLKKTKGFTISIKRNAEFPISQIENTIEYHKNKLATQDDNVGGYVDMIRDGKTVLAYSGSNKYNHYQAVISFHPDEYTSIGVRSNYHTLDELLPIFESIMK